MNTENEWRRSTFCDTGACIETRRLDDGRILIRNSGEHWLIVVTPAEFAAFVAGIRAGEFDDLTVTNG